MDDPRSARRAVTFIVDAIASIFREDRLAGSREMVWRFSGNPVIDRHPIPKAFAIFNSAALPFEDEYAGVFGTEYNTRMP